MDRSLSKFHEIVKDRKTLSNIAVHRVAESDISSRLNNNKATPELSLFHLNLTATY